jgi:rod shape-determining protein MreD
VSLLSALRIGAVVFVATILQVSALNAIHVLGATPDLLLVVLVSVALLRGSVVGAAVGFAAGLTIDLATMATLGVSALLLTVAGYWAGRYAETTGRGRAYAPIVAVVAITLLVGLGGFGLHYMLGESVSAQRALTPLPAAVVINALIAYPVYGLVRRLIGRGEPASRAREVELVV